jgi:hypothetical protein
MPAQAKNPRKIFVAEVEGATIPLKARSVETGHPRRVGVHHLRDELLSHDSGIARTLYIVPLELALAF